MKDRDKTKARLLKELAELRQRLAEQESLAARYKQEELVTKQHKRALWQSEARYQAIVEDQTELICRFRPNGILTFVNGAYCRYFGKSYDQLVGHSYTRLIPEEERDFVNRQRASLGPDKPVITYEHRVIVPSGETRWQQWTDRAILDDKDRIVEYQSVGRDITRLKEVEMARRDSEAVEKQYRQELHRANTELERRIEELLILNLIAQTITTMADLPAALDTVAGTLTLLFDARGTIISLLDENQTTLTTVAHFERIPVTPNLKGKTASIMNDPLVSQLMARGQPIMVTNAQEDRLVASWSDIMQARQLTCLLAVPLWSRGEIIGLLGLSLNQPDRQFTPSEIKLAETIAAQLGNVLENTRLFEEERRQRQLAESLRQVAIILNSSLDRQTVLSQIFEQLGQLIHHDGGGVFLQERDRLVLVEGIGETARVHIGKHIPLTTPNPTARVFNSKQGHIVPDGTKEPHWMNWSGSALIQSWIGVPLRAGETVIGVLTVERSDIPHAYTETDAQTLQVFANHAALAIENARLFEQTRRDAHVKEMLLEEVNHRVQNNLAAIIGLLYVEQSHSSAENEQSYQAIMSNLISRVQGLATVHRMLTHVEWSPLRLSDLAEQIIHSALKTLPSDKRIQVTVTPSPVQVTADVANSLALIINELVLNALKQAWPDCHLSVCIEESQGNIILKFQDDGPGYPAEIPHKDSYNTGWELIHSLVTDRLRGQLEIDHNGGTVTTIRFPIPA